MTAGNDAQETTVGRPGRALFAWCLYDWANSAYPTVVVTFVFSAYYTTTVAETKEVGTGEWGTAMALSGLTVALLAPVVGAVADQGGRRKPWLGGFTILSVVCAALLWFVEPDPGFALLALLVVGFGNAAFEFGQVFYNAMLPDVAPPDKLGRASGWAWSLGYAGGLACLAGALVFFVRAEDPLLPLDPARAEPVRIIGPYVALWFALFAVPLFLYTPDIPARALALRDAVRRGLASLRGVLVSLPRQGQVGRFLLARMVYTDGLNTLFTFGGLYAAGTFGMSFEEILIFGIVLNVASGLGALGFAWVDDWIGAKRTVVIALVGLIASSTAVLLVESREVFVALGCAIGIFIGPAQAASRSLMARMAPPELRIELFGLYALSGKATAFVGPALVGWVTVWAGSQRAGMATILIFFVLGLMLFLPLRDPAR